MNDIMDLHTHTIVSGHAYNTLYEMARAAADHGMKVFGSTDHAPGGIQGTCDEIYFKNFKVIPKHLFGLRLMMGCEVDIIDYQGSLDLKEDTLRRLDYAVASIHPQCYTCGTVAQNTAAYLGVLKNPYVKIIGHPDDGKFPLDYETVVHAAKENHRLIELNNTSLTPGSSRIHAYENDRILLPLCAEYQVPVIMNSDAHFTTAVGDHARAEALLRELHFPEELIANYHPEILKEYIPDLADFQG